MAARPDLLLSSTEALHGAVIRLARHHARVRWILERLCREAGEKWTPSLRIAGSFHDIGKLCLLAITERPGSLLSGERALLVLHPLIGEQLVSAAGWPGAARIIRHHHERWDGSGYPDGLAGEAIPKPARLLAAADCLAATSEPRPYRRAEPDVDAELRAAAGTQLDPSLVPALLRVARDLSEVRSP